MAWRWRGRSANGVMRRRCRWYCIRRWAGARPAYARPVRRGVMKPLHPSLLLDTLLMIFGSQRGGRQPDRPARARNRSRNGFAPPAAHPAGRRHRRQSKTGVALSGQARLSGRCRCKRIGSHRSAGTPALRCDLDGCANAGNGRPGSVARICGAGRASSTRPSSR